jgi:hypothetical protein
MELFTSNSNRSVPNLARRDQGSMKIPICWKKSGSDGRRRSGFLPTIFEILGHFFRSRWLIGFSSPTCASLARANLDWKALNRLGVIERPIEKLDAAHRWHFGLFQPRNHSSLFLRSMFCERVARESGASPQILKLLGRANYQLANPEMLEQAKNSAFFGGNHSTKCSGWVNCAGVGGCSPAHRRSSK